MFRGRVSQRGAETSLQFEVAQGTSFVTDHEAVQRIVARAHQRLDASFPVVPDTFSEQELIDRLCRLWMTYRAQSFRIVICGAPCQRLVVAKHGPRKFEIALRDIHPDGHGTA